MIGSEQRVLLRHYLEQGMSKAAIARHLRDDQIQASVSAPVASLPPREPMQTVHFSMAIDKTCDASGPSAPSRGGS